MVFPSENKDFDFEVKFLHPAMQTGPSCGQELKKSPSMEICLLIFVSSMDERDKNGS